jgi:hypothetical protein
MNKYLLLRDNKQSGPYSVDELAAHGLKAYDLVWLEGKSAAWRYPSEITELKPFAPVVEEQPFDRFYKKSEPKTIEPAVKDNTRVQESSSVHDQIKKPDQSVPSKQYIELTKGSKKIHVSLPGTKSVESSNIKPPGEELRTTESPPVIPAVQKEKPLSQPVLNADSVTYAYNKKSQQPDARVNFEEAYKKSKQKTPVTNNPSNEAPVSRLLFRSVAAVCLLLGGALIGLIINYNSQQKKFQQLNQLVQEIKQQGPGTSKTVKNDHLSDEVQMPKTDPRELNQPVEEPVYKEDIHLPPAKKDRRDAKSARGNADSLSQVRITPEVVPAILQNEESGKIDKVASDLARKNLWQLVSVDHNTYKTGVFGGISNLSLKLSNKSLFQLEQVEVEVLFLSPEKKTVNKQKVVFENVSPGEQLLIDVPKSSRGVKIEYSIKKISTKEFELAHAGM